MAILTGAAGSAGADEDGPGPQPAAEPTPPPVPPPTPAVAASGQRGGRRWRWLSLGLVAMVVAFTAGSVRLFLYPTLDRPDRVDAIVALGGVPGGLARALALSRAGYASTLVVSTPGNGCPPGAQAGAGVRVICFWPQPVTTQGEGREVRLLAARDGWRKVIVVARRTQATRARLRVDRCFPGDVLLAAPSMPARDLPYNLAYEWGALVKALLLQRTC